MFKIKSILSIIFYSLYGILCLQLTQFPGDPENVYFILLSSSILRFELLTVVNIRVRLLNTGTRFMSCYVPFELYVYMYVSRSFWCIHMWIYQQRKRLSLQKYIYIYICVCVHFRPHETVYTNIECVRYIFHYIVGDKYMSSSVLGCSLQLRFSMSLWSRFCSSWFKFKRSRWRTSARGARSPLTWHGLMELRHI